MTPETNTTTPTAAPDLTNIGSDALIERYVGLRDMRDAAKAEHDAQLAPYEGAIQMLAAELERRMLEQNVDSVKTKYGTASRVVTSTAMCEDWAAFEKWAVKNNRLDGFTRKLVTGPFKEMLEETGELPPGVRIQQQARMQVRRAARK